MVRAMTYTNPFGEVENKDLAEDPSRENKSADSGGVTDPDEESSEEGDVPDPTVTVLGDADGETPELVVVEMLHHDFDPYEKKNLIPGDVVEVRSELADTLIAGERAKRVE